MNLNLKERFSLTSSLKLFATDLFDFFLPRFCPSCKQKLSYYEDIICLNCFNSIQEADQSRIIFEYDKKFKEKNYISGFTSLFVFEKDKALQEILHQFKYNHKFRIGLKLGKELAKRKSKLLNEWNIDLIIPVPLHHLKKAERGYNQSFYIAKGISKEIKIPVKEFYLKRKRYTESQTMKNLSEREMNVREAFTVKKKKAINGKIILLIDDVITTGATISECARKLLSSGAAKVHAASIAIAD